ncbi:hypothetical protein FZEAL_5832 [Fusarium zealandicum]|uniref:Zonadhesin n=1 Tax=Fusarium zealandicum TaxID=1053134 RepID=A0A8H4UJQ2_9HYPO|nr:hypothetical protein FZEAL_5832 [Fusarium zealandicum]
MQQPQYQVNSAWTQHDTYEYKPVSSPHVSAINPDVPLQSPSHSDKAGEERPDYRPIPLRWPFISAIIIVLLGFMGAVIYAVQAMGDSDTTAKLDTRSVLVTREVTFEFVRRQDEVVSDASEEQVVSIATEPTQAPAPEITDEAVSDPAPVPDSTPTDAPEPEPEPETADAVTETEPEPEVNDTTTEAEPAEITTTAETEDTTTEEEQGPAEDTGTEVTDTFGTKTEDEKTATGTDDLEDGLTLTTALVEAEVTKTMTSAGSVQVLTEGEEYTETTQFESTMEISIAAYTTVSEISPDEAPSGVELDEPQYTTIVQPPQLKTSVTLVESNIVKTVDHATTRAGPPVTYVEVGTTTLYSVLTLNSDGEILEPPVTQVKTSEIPATVKTIVDATPQTVVTTGPDGLPTTIVTTPLPTTRLETIPATRVVVTAVATPTGDTSIVLVKTTYTLTSSGYFIGKFLPPIVAVLLAMTIRALNQAAQQYQPLAALSRPGGALGREALTLSFDGWKGIILPFQLLANSQPLPFLTALAGWGSALFAPLASEAVGLKIRGRCKKGAIDGCALELGVSVTAAYALIALIAVLAVLLVVALLVVSRRWRTGVYANPWCSAGAAALVARNPEMRPLAGNDYRTLKDSVVDKRFVMGWFRNSEGRDEYGLVLLGHDGAGVEGVQAQYNGLSQGEGMAYRPQTRHRAPQTFMALRFWYRFAFMLLLICMLAFVCYYHFVGTFSSLPKSLLKVMESSDFGVRFICAALGMVVILCWETLFTSIAVITPFRRMAKNPQVPTRSVLMTPPTNAISGVFVALRVRDPLLFFTSLAAVLAEFLPILLANVPYNLTQTLLVHEVCARLSAGILVVMVIGLFASLFVKWPALPVDPRSLAGAMWYVAEAPWVAGIEGVAGMSAKERQNKVQGLGGRWTYGPVHTAQGDRMGIEHGNTGFRG